YPPKLSFIVPSKASASQDPQVFSVVGYEIKNGTSQAAPFVSAAVALLKGIDPQITSDQIYHRLALSSQISATKKSINFRLPELISTAHNDSFLVPLLKEVSTLYYNPQSRQVKFNLGFKNYGEAVFNGEVAITIKNKNRELWNKNIKIIGLVAGQNSNLPVEINDITSEEDSLWEINIQTPQGNYTQFPTAVTQSGQESEQVAEYLMAESQNNDTANLDKLVRVRPGGQIVTSLRTVYDYYSEFSFPEYYSYELVAKEGCKISLWRPQENNSLVHQLMIANCDQLAAIRKVDLNGDGQADYLIYGRAVDPDLPDTDAKKKYLFYYYLDNQLKPLYPKSYFRYYPEMVVLELYDTELEKNHGLVKVSTSQGEMRVPMAIRSGYVPTANQNPDRFKRDEETDFNNHLYYLTPDLESGRLNTRIIDDFSYREKIGRSFKLKWNDKINILGFIHHPDLRRGKAWIQLSIGRSPTIHYYALAADADGAQQIIENIQQQFYLPSYHRIPMTVISGQSVQPYGATSLVGVSTDLLSQVLSMNPQDPIQLGGSFRYDYPYRWDALLGSLSGLAVNDSIYALWESNNRLVMVVQGPGTQKSSTFPIDRVSFLPGNVFKEKYTPLVVAVNQPAIYVDATDLNADSIYTVKLSPEGFSLPLKDNVLLPKGCLGMQPGKWNGRMSFIFLCLREEAAGTKKLVLQSRPIL
ncbi:MAG: hypothetical protein WCG27_07485, partial [Pseudomonadota bacterium]